MVFIFAAILLCSPALSQEWLEAALVLSGCATAEETDQSVLDHYEYLHLRRVRINGGRLQELLTPYQIASVQDYRHRYGDILSPAELALVDGFSTEKVKALAPFLSFASSRLPGAAVTDTLQLRVKAMSRADFSSVAGKLLVDAGDAAQAGYARRYYFDGRRGGSFFATCNYPGGRFLAGNFNLRFGEGLLFWSGMQINTLSSADGFSRRGGGLSPSWSLGGEGTFRGFAADYSRGAWGGMAFVSESGWGGRLSAIGQSGSYGLNLLCSGGRYSMSADIKQRLIGADFFGEAAVSRGRWALVGGTRFPLSDEVSAAFRLQALPSSWTGRKYGEYTAAAALQYRGGKYVKIAGKSGFGSSELMHGLDAVASFRLLPVPLEDPGRKEFRTVVSWGFRPDSLIRTDTRFILRLRSYEAARAELRADAQVSDGTVSARLRLHGAWCGSPGFLAYAEYGWQGKVQLWLRGTVYRTGSWASRIYVYERDVPGSFSVPACYGEGSSLSLLCAHSYKARHFRLKSGLRGWISAAKKPGTKAGLRVQFTLEYQ